VSPLLNKILSPGAKLLKELTLFNERHAADSLVPELASFPALET
jgi:hypothetical protein